MAKRQFRDSASLTWDVWDVLPADLPARAPYDRRTTPRPPAPNAPPPANEGAPMVDPELSEGWLCFQSGAERRRFAPIPPQWGELPDAVLRVMLDVASPVPPSGETIARESNTADANAANGTASDANARDESGE